eukprot:s43_g17.t1
MGATFSHQGRKQKTSKVHDCCYSTQLSPHTLPSDPRVLEVPQVVGAHKRPLLLLAHQVVDFLGVLEAQPSLSGSLCPPSKDPPRSPLRTAMSDFPHPSSSEASELGGPKSSPAAGEADSWRACRNTLHRQRPYPRRKLHDPRCRSHAMGNHHQIQGFCSGGDSSSLHLVERPFAVFSAACQGCHGPPLAESCHASKICCLSFCQALPA